MLTTQQIAEAYGTDSKVISNNFNRNRERYVEGKHFICLEGDELKVFKTNHHFDESSKINKLYLWTQKGAFLHAKSLNTDKAWEVYDHLVDSYFEKKQQEKVEAIDKDLQEFKRDLPLLGVECQKITYAKNQKVVPLLGGKDAPAYKNRSIRQKVYTDIDNQLRREFGVNTYKAIKRSQTDLAISIIKEYDLPMVLKNEIDAENAQECLW